MSKWVPPATLSARTLWARKHPWIAGCYFATIMSLAFSLLFPQLIGSPANARSRVLLALVLWLPTMLLFAMGSRRRWLERPDADAHPLPTYRRPFSNASDGFVRSFMWAGILGMALTPVVILSGVVPLRESLLGFLGAGSFTWTTWRERRYRRREDD